MNWSFSRIQYMWRRGTPASGSLSHSPSHNSYPSPSLPCHPLSGLILMSSRTTGRSSVSCKSGNNNSCFFWILFCLLPKFLGTPIAHVNFLLIKAIDRCPSSVHVLDACKEITI